MIHFSGCGTAVVTPFRGDGALDEQALRALVEWQVESEIKLLVACGTTGETPTLSEDEWLRVVEIVVEAADGRVPVLAGCTHNSTREAALRAKKVARVSGVSGILTANPYYNKPTQEGQFQHFKAIAEESGMPVVLYNIPSRTGTNLEPLTIARLAEIENIVAVKESSGSIPQIAELLSLVPSDFKVLAGDDTVGLAVLGLGGAGVISVASNVVPAEMAEMADAAIGNDWERARRINRKYFRLMLACFWETNPIPVKCLLAMMGKIEECYRLPMVPPQPATRGRLEKLAEELGMLERVPQQQREYRVS